MGLLRVCFAPILAVISFLFYPLRLVLSVVTRPIWDKIVQKCYVEQILFNTAWEDPRVDAQVLDIKENDTALIITSAGCNALALALQNPEHVYSIDRNPCQNALFELKIAGIRELSYENFWKLFGEGWMPGFTKDYYPVLRQHLSPEARNFWDSRTHYFDGGWVKRSFYMRGCSGVLALGMRAYVKLLGLQGAVNDLFRATTLEEQQNIYSSRIEKRLFNPVLMFFISQPFTLSLLNGVPASQSELLTKDSPDQNIGLFIKQSLEYVMTQQPISENYFYRVYLTGKYTKDCCPEYLTPEGFAKLQGGLIDKVSVHTMTITEFLQNNPDTQVSRFVLLDHMDWLVNLPEVLSEEWEEILKHSPEEGAKYIWRSASKSTDFVLDTRVQYNDRTQSLKSILSVNSKLGEELTKQDRVHTYTSFHIADLSA
jgi:S-adenosylmethionine-diacylglycerol 3-amino-3-carboxypropyl transferase